MKNGNEGPGNKQRMFTVKTCQPQVGLEKPVIDEICVKTQVCILV
jgi:hypothetical protein